MLVFVYVRTLRLKRKNIFISIRFNVVFVCHKSRLVLVIIYMEA